MTTLFLVSCSKQVDEKSALVEKKFRSNKFTSEKINSIGANETEISYEQTVV